MTEKTNTVVVYITRHGFKVKAVFHNKDAIVIQKDQT